MTNAQPEGIGRVVSLGDVCAWNNLGRNIVFADTQFRPVGIFAETLYPNDDELSQYDLDVHAIVEMPRADLFLVLNHLGVLRAFRASELRKGATEGRRLPPLRPLWTAHFAEDVERTVAVGNRLIGSRPRGEGAHGVVVSEPIPGMLDLRVGAEVELEAWGEVTALDALSLGGDDAIALGGEGRVSLFPLTDESVGPPRWEVEVDFRAATFVSDGTLLWVAGSDQSHAGVDDYDWENVRGGGFAGIDPADGAVVVSGRLPPEMAWGNGGVAIVLVEGTLCGVGRTGRVHRLGGCDGTATAVTTPLAATSLGIAHAAVVADRVLYGFNRGGYRLHVAAAATTRSMGAPT